MRKTIYLLGIALLGLFAGCEDDADGIAGDVGSELHLSALIDGLEASDAAYRFQGGQDVGFWLSSTDVSAVLNEADGVKNGRFSQSAGGLVSEPRMRWDSHSSLMVYGYSPYDSEAATNPSAYVFDMDRRQDTLANLPSGNGKCDFLWTSHRVERVEKPVALTFHHLMCKVVLHVKSSSAIPGSLVGGVLSVCNALPQAVIDLGKGEVTASGEKTRITAMELAGVPAGYEITREVILVPQTIRAGEQFLDVVTQGNYSCPGYAERDLVFEPGKLVTLEVVVDEGECDIRVQDVTAWREDALPIAGEAVEALPIFKLFDYYDRHGIQGIVIDVDETGTHGWIVSADDAWLPWSTYPMGTYWPNATSNNDGQANIDACRSIDPTLVNYPAMKWCTDKNTGGVTGWIMPSYEEVKLFARIISDWDLWNQFNAAIENCPLEEKWTVELDWEDYNSNYYLSSSTLVSFGLVKKAGCSVMNGMWYGGYYDDSLLDDQNFEGWVRAFHKF